MENSDTELSHPKWKWTEWLKQQSPESFKETLASIEKINEQVIYSDPEYMFRLSRGTDHCVILLHIFIFRCKLNIFVEGVYLDWKAEDPETLVYSPEFFLGKSIAELFDAKVAENSRQSIHSTLSTGEPSSFYYDLEIKGKVRKYLATFSKFSNEEVIVLIQEVKQIQSQSLRKRVAGKISPNVLFCMPFFLQFCVQNLSRML